MGVLTSHLNRCGSPDLIRFMADVDLSFTQVKMLMLLEDKGELSVKDVAGALNLSLPAASRAIDGLAQRGLVDRREDPGDRRQKRLTSTGAGREALRRLDEARLAGLAAFATTLPDAQCRRLSEALRPILDALGHGT